MLHLASFHTSHKTKPRNLKAFYYFFLFSIFFLFYCLRRSADLTNLNGQLMFLFEYITLNLNLLKGFSNRQKQTQNEVNEIKWSVSLC